MKNMFPGFYSPTDEELEAMWKDAKTLFVFDTNTLLNLYGYASQTRDDFFLTLDEISDKIWIPYHVGLEYQRRRLDVVKTEKAIFKDIEVSLSKIDKVFEHELQKLALKRRFPSISIKTDKLHKDIKKSVADYKKSLAYADKKQPSVNGHDEIRDALNHYFDGKIGSIPENQTILDEIYKEGKERYSKKIPPGYKDADKVNKGNEQFSYAELDYDRQYGDLIIWKQLIEKAKEDGVNAVVFVTDDAKEDWWYIISSRGEKTIGPRAELREEICREGDIEFFTMYSTSEFLENGKKLLDMDIRKESIADASESFTTVKIDINKLYGIDKNTLNSVSELAKVYEDARKNMLDSSIIRDYQSMLNNSGVSAFVDNAAKYKKIQEDLDDAYKRTMSGVTDLTYITPHIKQSKSEEDDDHNSSEE